MTEAASLHQLSWDHFSVKMNREHTAELLLNRKWVDREVIVQWDKTTTVTYVLRSLNSSEKESEPTFRQPTANAFLAESLPNMPRSLFAKFVIRLPDLEVLCDLGRVGSAYAQEYNLRDRFPPGTPDVLPTLLPCKWTDAKESGHPSVLLDPEESQGIREVPCVIREFIEGMSLKTYIGRQAPHVSAEMFGGLERSDQWFALAVALFQALAELHRERATHGFVFPGNIVLRPAALRALQDGTPIPPGEIVFINAAESQRSVYFEESKLTEEAKRFPVRRWYDSDRNVYRFAGEEQTTGTSGERAVKWVRFDLEEGSDYYSAADVFSLGVTLVYLATGNIGSTSPFQAVSPFDYVEEWRPGWQIVRGAHIRRRYHVMKAKLLDCLMAASRQRARQAQQGTPASMMLKASEGDANPEEASIYDDSLRRAEVILQCVRSRMERRVYSPNHALTVVRMFRPREQTPTPLNDGAPMGWKYEDYARLIELARRVEADPSLVEPFVDDLLNHDWLRSADKQKQYPMVPAIRSLVGHRMRSVLERITALDNEAAGPSFGLDHDWRTQSKRARQPFLRVMGSRTTLVDAFLTALSTLSSEDELIALTTAATFNDDNFGPTSRITSMLQLLRLAGMPMRWVILVSSSDLYKPITQRVLGFRAADDRRLEELRPGLVTGMDVERPVCYSGFFCACLERKQYERLLREKKTFIGFRKKKPPTERDDPGQNPLELHIAPDLSSRAGRLVALTFWMHPRRNLRLRTAHAEYLHLARPMLDFARIL